MLLQERQTAAFASIRVLRNRAAADDSARSEAPVRVRVCWRMWRVGALLRGALTPDAYRAAWHMVRCVVHATAQLSLCGKQLSGGKKRRREPGGDNHRRPDPPRPVGLRARTAGAWGAAVATAVGGQLRTAPHASVNGGAATTGVALQTQLDRGQAPASGNGGDSDIRANKIAHQPLACSANGSNETEAACHSGLSSGRVSAGMSGSDAGRGVGSPGAKENWKRATTGVAAKLAAKLPSNPKRMAAVVQEKMRRNAAEKERNQRSQAQEGNMEQAKMAERKGTIWHAVKFADHPDPVKQRQGKESWYRILEAMEAGFRSEADDALEGRRLGNFGETPLHVAVLLSCLASSLAPPPVPQYSSSPHVLVRELTPQTQMHRCSAAMTKARESFGWSRSCGASIKGCGQASTAARYKVHPAASA